MKLLNLTYNDPERWQEVRRIAGDDIPFLRSLRLGGSGSPKAILTKAPGESADHLRETVDRNQCNIEVRTKGVVIRYRIRQEVWGIVIDQASISAVTVHGPGTDGQLVIRFECRDTEALELNATTFNAVAWKSFLRKHFSLQMREAV